MIHFGSGGTATLDAVLAAWIELQVSRSDLHPMPAVATATTARAIIGLARIGVCFAASTAYQRGAAGVCAWTEQRGRHHWWGRAIAMTDPPLLPSLLLTVLGKEVEVCIVKVERTIRRERLFPDLPDANVLVAL